MKKAGGIIIECFYAFSFFLLNSSPQGPDFISYITALITSEKNTVAHILSHCSLYELLLP